MHDPHSVPLCRNVGRLARLSSRLFIVAGTLFASLGLAAESGDAASAKRCFKCHGENGLDSSEGEPFIAGQPYAYILESLEHFQSGERISKSMQKATKDLTREDMEAVSRYFSWLPNVAPPQSFDPVLAQKGARIHARWCNDCHEKGGQGFQFKSVPGPILAGQSATYLHNQFAKFMTLDRDMPTDMGIAMLEMRPGDANALVHYYVSNKHAPR